MEPDAPLDYMLDPPSGPPAGREELQAIVARSGRRRTRITAAGMALTLVIGGAAGWAVRSGGSTHETPVATAGAATTTTVAAPSAFVTGGGVAVAGGPVAPPAFTFTKKFVRTTGEGVTIRAYQQGTTPAVKNICGFGPGLLAEVSTADVASAVGGGFPTAAAAAPFVSVSSNAIGVIEGAPVGVVTVRTEASVAQVRVTFADGKTDQMAPVDGWSVLAHLLPAAASGQATLPTGSVQALDASGKVTANLALTTPLPPKVLPPPAVSASASPPPGPAPALSPPSVGLAVPTTVPGGKVGQAFKACNAPLIIPTPGIPVAKTTTIPAGTASTAVCGC